MTGTNEPLYYWDYLGLDAVLHSQITETGRHGDAAHDEMLFIITHQAFELWFKQILHELHPVLEIMGGGRVHDKEMGQVVDHLGRIVAIQPLLIDQFDVLETLTPLDFLEFRDHLVPASGFQSVQFRLIENRLGLPGRHRLRILHATYTSVMREDHRALLERSEREPSLLDHVNDWLERTPFLVFGEFKFWESYRAAVTAMLDRERETIEAHPTLDAETRAAQHEIADETASTFESLFDQARYDELVVRGQRVLSREAFLAALLINLYRDEPIFQLPFRLLTRLIEIDEGFTSWRQRHALMVHRMIGGKVGTGGTSGHDYLAAAARKHRVFRDLFDLPTFFLPRSELPLLPPEVSEQMGFRYQPSG